MPQTDSSAQRSTQYLAIPPPVCNLRVRTTNTSGTGHGGYAYQYDYRTRRVYRDEPDTTGTDAALSFSGGLSVQEYAQAPGGTPVYPAVETLRGSDLGGGVGGVVYTLRGNTPTYDSYNSRGDLVSQTGSNGAVQWQASYEAFGTRKAEQAAPGATNLDRQRSNTKDEDPTGLLNEGMRYRDLETGVFITRDPAGFVDGPNVYTYVMQNPWSGFDKEGLDIVKFGKALLRGDFARAASEFEIIAGVPSTSYAGIKGYYDSAKNIANTATGSFALARGAGDSTADAAVQSTAMVAATLVGTRDVDGGHHRGGA